jgi:hypothetical protein
VATTRTAGGRFKSAYRTLDLYEIVRAVAEFAKPDEPTLITEAAWDKARAGAGYPDAPTARANCARLADDQGNPFPWRELLELVFDDERDIPHTHALRQGSRADEDLDEEDVYYALRRVAKIELGQDSLRPGEYRRERERLLAADARRRNLSGGVLLADLLPTVGQLERIAGDWDAALMLAELGPRRTPTRNGHADEVVPIVEVLDRFADEADGWFCRRAQLLEYARNRKIVMAGPSLGSSWADYIATATARREAKGALTRGLPPAGTFPAYPGMGAAAETDADQEPRRRANKPRDYWTLERCVEAVRDYFDEPDEAERPSQARYGNWAADRPDAPSASTFGKHGGWRVVSKLARLRGPLPPELHTPGRREQAEAAVLAHLAEHGRVKNADVQTLLGVGEDKARRTLNALRERGVIELGSKHAVGRSVFYVRADAAAVELQNPRPGPSRPSSG